MQRRTLMRSASLGSGAMVAAGTLAAPAILRTRAYIEANWKENYTSADSLLTQGVRQLASRWRPRPVWRGMIPR